MMPGAAAASTSTRAAEPAITTFFRLLYGSATGHAEVAWIDGDPDDREHHRFGREWFAYAPERLSALRARVEELCRCFGNVYVSAQLYTRPSRQAATQSGRVIVVDDLPAGVACSFSVQTSPHSRHGYFLLDREANADELRDLARRAAYALGGDRGGWDTQQLVRVPGTLNTKARHGGRFRVRFQLEDQRRYRSDELRERWPGLEAQETVADAPDWPEVEHWLGNLDALIGANGLPRRVKPTTQTGRVLQQGLGDTSLARFIVAKGLALHGYPNAEIAALLWHYCDYGKLHAKGSAWLKGDIQRILGKVRAQVSQITPSPTQARRTQPATGLPNVQPSRRGRKTTLTPEALLAWYEEQRTCGDSVLLTVAEVAERLEVSRATVERCERTLREQGVIERRCFNRRQASLIVILRPLTNPESAPGDFGERATAAEAATPAADPRPLTIPNHIPAFLEEPAAQDRAGEEAEDRGPITIVVDTSIPTPVYVPSPNSSSPQQEAENSEYSTHEGTHAPDATVAPPPAASSLAAVAPPQELAARSPREPNAREAVAEALAAITGRKRTRKAVWAYVSRLHGPRWSPEAIDYHRRALLASEPYDEERKRLASLRDAELYGALRSSERYTMRREDGTLSSWHRWRVSAALDEFRRRELPIEAPAERKERTRRAAELKYQIAQERSRPLPTVAEQQASWNEVLDREADELFEELEWARVRGELPKAQGFVLHRALLQQPGTAGGVCSTQRRGPSSPKASALITRLHARKEQQAHTAIPQAHHAARDRPSCIDLDEPV